MERIHEDRRDHRSQVFFRNRPPDGSESNYRPDCQVL